MICVKSVLVAVWACVMLVWREACETPPLKLVAMVLICCSQLPIAEQTLFAYASLAFVSELPPQPAATSVRTATSARIGVAVTHLPAR